MILRAFSIGYSLYLRRSVWSVYVEGDSLIVYIPHTVPLGNLYSSFEMQKCVRCKLISNEANKITLLVAGQAIAHTSTRQLQ
jgi:hypothetical protein